MDQRRVAEIFEEARPRLLGLAYRTLGSRADAEDAVQDAYLKWRAADHDAIETPAAWLTTICTRRCLDLLRAAHRRRVDYVGAWLPEPIQAAVDADAATGHAEALSASLSTAFLLVLERLSPKERAAYLLREIFDTPYAEVAATLELSEPACRKLVSRAKAQIGEPKPRTPPPAERQDSLLAAFETAIRDGVTAPLAALLADDVRLSADSGGKVPSIREALEGKQVVLSFVAERLSRFWAEFDWRVADLNGGRGVILTKQGVVAAAASFAYDADQKLREIYIMRNPEKLAALDPAIIR